MTKLERDLLEVRRNVSLTVLGAMGGGPPLKYLWIPLVIVALPAVALWML